MTWLRITADGVLTISLHIQPGAKKTEFAGLHGDALKLRLAAPPVDGKANDALIKFFAKQLALPKAAILLKSGQASRQKVIEITGVTSDQISILKKYAAEKKS